ncbi:hypothetical protein AFLA_000463 [Aspergillus flavus NRRL3357]|nr:hypothetical protein AFLA_000463 [Aspergillus flavus NRRL3357]
MGTNITSAISMEGFNATDQESQANEILLFGIHGRSAPVKKLLLDHGSMSSISIFLSRGPRVASPMVDRLGLLRLEMIAFVASPSFHAFPSKAENSGRGIRWLLNPWPQGLR